MEKPQFQTFILFHFSHLFLLLRKQNGQPCITAPHLFLLKISIGMSPCRDKSGNCCNALRN